MNCTYFVEKKDNQFQEYIVQAFKKLLYFLFELLRLKVQNFDTCISKLYDFVNSKF